MPLVSKFRKMPLEERQAMSKRQLEKRPEWCPLVVEPVDKNQKAMKGSCKFLFQRDLTMAAVQATIRKRLEGLAPEEALWTFIWDETDPKDPKAVQVEGSKTVGVCYDTYKGEDGFMLLQYTSENVFGAM